MTIDAIAKILNEDRVKIAYRPSWRHITGSITSAILLQQVRFRWVGNGGKPFYKFFEPPKTENKAYRPGDSWTEELGFTVHELRGALNLVGKRLSRAEVADLGNSLDGHFFGYFQDQSHLTWYYFNETYFNQRILEHYTGDDKSPHSNFPGGESPGGKSPSGHIEKVEPDIPETTTETTTLSQQFEPEKFTIPDNSKGPHPDYHPAILAYKAEFGRLPDRTLWVDIKQNIGADPASQQTWREVCKAWHLEGYRADNMRGLFDWYQNGIPQREAKRDKPKASNGNGNGAAKTGTTGRPKRKFEEGPGPLAQFAEQLRLRNAASAGD